MSPPTPPTPPLGWIGPDQRTREQNDAHELNLLTMPRFFVPGYQEPPRGTKVILSTAWTDPGVVADCGIKFDRSPFQQLTGSCVGAGGGNALFALIAVQRKLAENATRAIIPFWPFSYGRCRFLEGDRGQGEGAMGSSFAAQVAREGVLASTESGLPQFKNTDGLELTSRLEMQWSDGGSSLVTHYLSAARAYPLGTAAPLHTTQDMKVAALNGYPGTFACDLNIAEGSSRILGSGENAACVSKWNRSGGHQQWFFGWWDNLELGPLFAIGNNWARDTYQPDPAGLPLCCCWVREADVQAAFAYHAEVYAFSHLNWFPLQIDKLLSWYI